MFKKIVVPLTFFVIVAEVFFLFQNPFNVRFKGSLSQLIYIGILILYFLQGSSIFFIHRISVWNFRARGKFARKNITRKKIRRTLYYVYKYPEFVFVITLAFFIFSYIFASNANMDYVQRFMAMGGKLNLAIDSHIERSASALKFVPLLFVSLLIMFYYRLKYPALASRVFNRWKKNFIMRGVSRGYPPHRSNIILSDIFSVWGIFWILLSVVLFAFAFPSFVNSDGYPLLAWVSIIPLFLTLEISYFRSSVFYGTSFGVFQAMLTNYWLGTFSLVSLQFVASFFVLYYVIFISITLWFHRFVSKRTGWGFIVFPVAWVVFDFLRTGGFLGYPWGIIGVTQYRFIALIQISSLTGVWGVSFIVVLFNSVVATVVLDYIRGRADYGVSSKQFKFNNWLSVSSMRGVIVFVLLIIVYLGYGAVELGRIGKFYEEVRSKKVKNITRVRLALVQQNTDPRKNDYEDTFRILKKLTNSAMRYKPDIVVWSETAFVPNIRRWSREDPKKYPLAKLVKEFLAYQKTLGTWLLTGNDDYLLIKDKNGKITRYDYNASVLFSPEGRRVKTYHKIKLVPFTEYFPYKKELPGLYHLLLNFDVNLWEPGSERVVFHHPKFTFSTPICFEDAFPAEVRLFVLNGADVIINLSNDYWSLTPVEAKQHFINAIFRAVENRRPLLRATASGITAYVDILGRVVKTIPVYKEGYMIVDLPVVRYDRIAKKDRYFTPYTKIGDWFPIFLFTFLGIVIVVSVLVGLISPEGGSGKTSGRKRVFDGENGRNSTVEE